MKIKRVTLWRIPLTSHTAYYMANGKTCDTVDTIVLRVDTDSALVGWGEVCPIPHYLPAYACGVAPALTEIAPVLLGANPMGVEPLMSIVNKWLIGHAYVKSPLDMALWDITAKAAGLPLYELIGGRRQETLPLYHSITCVAPDDMAHMAREAQRSGITQFQVKLGADNDIQADIERLVKVREAVGSGPLVYGDWNCGATQLEASRVARAVSHLDLMLEQPCPTLRECAAVRRASGLPMKMDECAYDTASLWEAYQLGILDAVALKLSKFGGITPTRQARDLTSFFGAKLCVEDTWGSDIATAAALHVGISTAPSQLLNVCDLSGYVSPRLDDRAPVRRDGRIAPPSGIGLGVQPDLDRLGVPELVLE